MAREDRTQFADDADLVAYIDGELALDVRAALQERLAREPALAERMRMLESGGRPFRKAFDEMLDAAPIDRLSAMLESELRRPPRRAAPRRWPTWAAIAASLVLFVVGVGAGQALRSFDLSDVLGTAFGGWDGDAGGWADMLASDLALYTPQSLAVIPPDRTPSDSELAAIGAKLDVALSNERLALPGLALKQARLLAFQDAPFIQLVYLDPQHGALGFCIFLNKASAEGLESLTSAGMDVVYWKGGGKGYMLIGHAPTAELQGLADILAKKFPPANA